MASTADIARLAAGAQGGTAGVAAYDQAQKQVGSSRDAAVSAIQQSAQQLRAPGALTRNLTSMVGAPATTAMQNLQRYGAADAGAQQQDAAGTSLYSSEASQAIPVINAEANLDLAQKIAMLNASSQRASAAKAPKQLSNAALKVDLLGAAQQYRAQQAQQDAADQQKANNAKYSGAIANAFTNSALGLFGDQLPGTPAPAVPPGVAASAPLGGWGSVPAPAPASSLAAIPGLAERAQAARAAALQNIQQQQYGPGLTDLAQQLAQVSGVDPNQAAGILTPAVDQQFVHANEKLGLYKDPNAATIANQIAPVGAAGQALGFAPDLTTRYLGEKYFDWGADPKLNTTFQKWLALPSQASLAGKPLADQQRAFEQAPGSANDAKNIVQDVVADAHAAINRGYDYQTFARQWSAQQIASQHPASVALGLKMVEPLFQYNAAQTRTYNPNA